MIRRPPRSTLSSSSAASDVYKRQEKSLCTSVQPVSKGPRTAVQTSIKLRRILYLSPDWAYNGFRTPRTPISVHGVTPDRDYKRLKGMVTWVTYSATLSPLEARINVGYRRAMVDMRRSSGGSGFRQLLLCQPPITELSGTLRAWNDLPFEVNRKIHQLSCLLYTSPSPRDGLLSRMPSSA